MREFIDQTVESLDERFTEKQIEPLKHLTKFVTKLESKESITFLANLKMGLVFHLNFFEKFKMSSIFHFRA